MKSLVFICLLVSIWAYLIPGLVHAFGLRSGKPPPPPYRPPVAPHIPPPVPQRPLPQPYRPPTVIVRPQTTHIIVLRPRPVTHIVIHPVIHPVPVYTIVLYSRQPVYTISTGACTKSTGETLSGFCQTKIARKYDLSSLTTTKRTCCATYEEAACYMQYAGSFCSKSDQNSLMNYNLKVANYFESTICRSVPFANWENVCSGKVSVVQNSKIPFIQLPSQTGYEQTCMSKLRSTSEGNLVEQCLNATIDLWDPNRKKLVERQIGDTCCAMYDLLDCVYNQAVLVNMCTGPELKDLDNYRKVSAHAFTGGVCRALPYEQADKVCRGKSSAMKHSLDLIMMLIMISLITMLYMY